MEIQAISNEKQVLITKSVQMPFFCYKYVDSSCIKQIKAVFETLLYERELSQGDLARFLGVDKAYVSRVVNGLQFPPKLMMLKIANFFNVDTRIIWP